LNEKLYALLLPRELGLQGLATTESIPRRPKAKEIMNVECIAAGLCATSDMAVHECMSDLGSWKNQIFYFSVNPPARITKKEITILSSTNSSERLGI
jgi:hypothetical protein